MGWGLIAPIQPSDAMERNFVVADIENRSDGTLLSVQTYDGRDHYAHFTWGEWIVWLAKRGQTDHKFRRVYAHNGGGWDWLSLIEWMIKYDRSHTFGTVQNGARIVCLSIPISGHNKFTLRLCDSICLLPTSLDKAAAKFLGERKIKLEHLPEWYWENDREKYWEYAYHDCSILYDCLHRFLDVIYTHIARIGKVGLTLPSTALRCFQTGFLDREIGTPSNEKACNDLRKGYTGGRVEVFRGGYYNAINVYDFNSLYPSVMLSTNVPMGEPVSTTRYLSDRIGCWYIRFNQRNRDRLPLLLIDGLGQYSGEGWYYSPEVSRLVGEGRGEIEVIEGWYWKESAPVFKRYVETLYALRMTDKNGPIGETCKLMMNSLYGKFGQKSERTSVKYVDIDDIKALRKTCEVELLNAELGVYRITEHKHTHFQHVGIAGVITSEARARLWEAFDADTVYCDTDSIHTPNTKVADSTTLGALKLEYTGEGVYCGKKLYALRNGVDEKIRAKGIRVGGENGHPLTFDSLLQVANGASIECHFKSATTSTDVYKGKQSCRFVNRMRTIRDTTNVRTRKRARNAC